MCPYFHMYCCVLLFSLTCKVCRDSLGDMHFKLTKMEVDRKYPDLYVKHCCSIWHSIFTCTNKQTLEMSLKVLAGIRGIVCCSHVSEAG